MANNIMNGVAIIDVNENETKSIFFDREVVEFAKLRSKIKKNRQRKEDEINRKNKRIADAREKVNRKKAETEKKKAEWRLYTVNTFYSIFLNLICISAVVWVYFLKLVSPYVAIPIILYVFAKSCIKFGMWFAKATSR